MSSSLTTWSSNGRGSASLEVHLLGVVDFDSACLLQERLVYEISGRNDRLGNLLICEHPPLITIGREGSRAHIRVETDELIARQMDVRWLSRGGGSLVHTPGQLAIYPIVPLDRLALGLSDYRGHLEQAVLDVCRELRIPAYRDPDEPGLWTRSGQFAHPGIAVKWWVAYHGVFLNVSPPMELMRLTCPNRRDDPVTSLAAEDGRNLSMHRVREAVIRHLADRLGYERFHLYTGHPLLRRAKKKGYVYA